MHDRIEAIFSIHDSGVFHMRKNIKIVVSYDGTRYLGWQRLSGKQKSRSIQGYLEEVLEQVVGCKIRLSGSGRTDAGVHALGQVANFFLPSALFHCDTTLQCNQWKQECNRQLPEDIKIQTMEEVPTDFHSRYSAVRKTYEYRIDMGERPCVFQRKYALWFPEKLNVDKMRQAADCIVGTHDFAAFSTGGKEKKDTVRTIYALDISKHGKQILISVCGDGFLYNMVRIIVGTLLMVGNGQGSCEQVMEALKSRNRQLAGKTVSSVGLFLKKVEY